MYVFRYVCMNIYNSSVTVPWISFGNIHIKDLYGIILSKWEKPNRKNVPELDGTNQTLLCRCVWGS